MNALETLPGSHATVIGGINDATEAVGYAQVPADFHGELLYPERAVVYSNGTAQNIGTLPGGFWSEASAINDAGQVVGYSQPDPGYAHAFLYSNGLMNDLGVPPGELESDAGAINASGQIVGDAWNSLKAYESPEAFLWSDGDMVNLNTLIRRSSGFVLQTATGINDLGQICGSGGSGTNSGWQSTAFLLSPLGRVEIASQPPMNISTNQPFSVTVKVEDINGDPQPNYSGRVTISMNSDGGLLSGSTTLQAVDGVATFDDLKVTGTSTFTLVASAVGMGTSAPTTPIVVTGNVQPPVLPQVTAVDVDGTNWTSSFMTALQTSGQGNGTGYAIPVGSSANSMTYPGGT